MNGCAAVISALRSGKVAACLIGGTDLTHADIHLTAPVANHQGVIEAVASRWSGDADNAFVTTAKLPAGDSLRGTWLHLGLGATPSGEPAATEVFEIDHVTVRDGRTWILLKDEPGLQMNAGSTSEIFFPRRRFTGDVRFTIHTLTVQP